MAMAAEPPTRAATERRAERKAAAQINKGNYKTELTKIEKELGSSAP